MAEGLRGGNEERHWTKERKQRLSEFDPGSPPSFPPAPLSLEIEKKRKKEKK